MTLRADAVYHGSIILCMENNITLPHKPRQSRCSSTKVVLPADAALEPKPEVLNLKTLNC